MVTWPRSLHRYTSVFQQVEKDFLEFGLARANQGEVNRDLSLEMYWTLLAHPVEGQYLLSQ